MPDASPRVARRRAARLNASLLGDVLAAKGDPPAIPAGATPRGGTQAAPPPRPARGISTSIEVPAYLMDNIAAHLRANGGHNMRTLLFAGLAALGIEVAPEDLVPQRRRRAR